MGDYRVLIAKLRVGATWNPVFDIQWADSTGLEFYVWNNAGQWLQAASRLRLDDGLWHHTVGTWDGTAVRIFVTAFCAARRRTRASVRSTASLPMLSLARMGWAPRQVYLKARLMRSASTTAPSPPRRLPISTPPAARGSASPAGRR